MRIAEKQNIGILEKASISILNRRGYSVYIDFSDNSYIVECGNEVFELNYSDLLSFADNEYSVLLHNEGLKCLNLGILEAKRLKEVQNG